MIANSPVKKKSLGQKKREERDAKRKAYRERLIAMGKKSIGDLDEELTDLQAKEQQAKELCEQYEEQLSEKNGQELYLKIYRKWKEREHRAADNHSISESGLEQLDRKLKQLIVMHREYAYRREEGRLNETDWAAALENYDNELYELWDNIKSHKCPTGEPTRGK